MSGWKLTAALITKHASVLGDNVASMLASWDPETATQVDRDNLEAKLREVATKLAGAKQKYDAAQKLADGLAASIANDKVAASILIGKFEKKEIDEATLNEFATALEADKQKLPGLQQDAADAKQLVDTLQEILDSVEKNLGEFDAKAKQAMSALAQANADKERAQLRQDNQAEMARLAGGAGGSSTGLDALSRAANKARVQADAANTIADIGQKPLDRQHAVDEARRIAAGGVDTTTESAADRMRRIAGD